MDVTELWGCDSVVLREQFAQVAGVGVSESGGYLFYSHFSVGKHVFHYFKSVLCDVLLIILTKISFKEAPRILGRDIELIGEQIQFQ